MANTQAFCDPFAVAKDKVGGTGIGWDALDGRHTLGALSQPSSGAAYGFMTGVFPGSSSEVTPSDLKGYAAGGMKTGALAGGYAVDRGALGVYVGAAIGANEAVLPNASSSGHGASNPSNPRIDLVVVRNRDPAIDSGVTETAKLTILQGNAAASPTRPDGLLSNGDVPVYQVLIRAGASTIADGDITSVRRFIVARGGIYPAVPGDTRPGAYDGQYRDQIAFKQLERWSAALGVWEAVATPAVWASFSPSLYAAGSAQNISIGKDAGYVGRCEITGKTLKFEYQFKWGTAPYNGGFGDINTFLPKHPVLGVQLYGTGADQWVQAHLRTAGAFSGEFFGQAKVQANSTKVTPYFGKVHAHQPPNNPIDMNTAPYRIAAEQSKPATGIPRIFNPDGYAEGGSLEISGSCEVTW